MSKILTSLFITLTIFLVSCAPKEPQDANKVFEAFKNEKNIEQKIAIFEEFKETNPDNQYLASLLSSIIYSKAKNKEYDKAAEYLNKHKDLATSSAYNTIAWGIYESKENLELGAKLAKKGVDLARAELKNAKDTKPEKVSIEDWTDSKTYSLAMVLDTYGSIEKEQGNIDNAIKILEESVSLSVSEQPELNENYVSAIIASGNKEKAKKLLEKYISNSTDSENMKDMLKEIFVEQGQSEKEFASYLKPFEEKAKQKLISKIKSEMKNEAAPDFELLDLDGKKVKLSDFKGKTIVLDFWATWCGPCLNSFPAMQKAVEKFKNVKFLFANTWERVENKKQNAIDFISKNKYPFHVLLDENNEVVGKYGVEGIPTKFIIDKNQNIRFQSVGFSGKEDEMLMELELIFSMIK